MSPRTGRPTNDKKGSKINIRLSENDLAKLEYCSERTKLTRAEIIRNGIDTIYNSLKESEATEKD